MELHGDRVVLRPLARSTCRRGIDEPYLRAELAAGLSFAVVAEGEVAGLGQCAGMSLERGSKAADFNP